MSCYRHILVAHDGSADGAAALEHATLLARDQHARITLLTVAPRTPQPTGISAPIAPDLIDCYIGSLRRAADSVPEDVSITTRVLRGSPAETILRVAREGEHDLIVMGSHGHSRLHRALLGSVSYRVLHDSPVPVLLIRQEPGVGASAEAPRERTTGVEPATFGLGSQRSAN